MDVAGRQVAFRHPRFQYSLADWALLDVFHSLVPGIARNHSDKILVCAPAIEIQT